MKWRLNKEKLFWLRKIDRGWSLEEAAVRTGVLNKRHYIRLEAGEVLRPRESTMEGLKKGFGLRDASELKLFPGESPELEMLNLYLHARESGVSTPSPDTARREKHSAKYRPFDLVAFDLDNTILRGFRYSWQVVWEYLGYNDSIRRAAMRKYLGGKISYMEWCNYCCCVPSASLRKLTGPSGA